MKKKIIIILLCAIVSVIAAVTYLNQVFLPVKLKSMIVKSLEDVTHKKVGLGEVRFNVLKGLVVRNLIVFDDTQPLIRLQEGACSFVIPAIFKKTVLIPSIKLTGLEIFLERRVDSSFNINELFTTKPTQEKKAEFRIIVRKIKLSDGVIHFRDNSLPMPFSKDIRNISLFAYLSLPARVKFTLNSQIEATPAIKLEVVGEFRIPEKLLNTKVTIQNLSLKEAFPYYQKSGISFPSGLLNAVIKSTFKDEVLACQARLTSNALTIIKRNVTIQLTSDTQGQLQYNFRTQGVRFSGISSVRDSRVSGVAVVDTISAINGELTFDTTSISGENLRANVWDLPVQVKARLADFANPVFTITASTPLGLDRLSRILKEKFNFNIPALLSGDSALLVNLNFQPAFQFDGHLDIIKGEARFEKIPFPIQDIQGRVVFSDKQVGWSNLHAQYDQKQYTTSGTVLGYHAPQVQWELASDELVLKAGFAYKDKLFSIAQCDGQYLNSKFALQGTVDTTEPSSLNADLRGGLELSLSDAKTVFKKFQPKLETIRLAGLLHSKLQVRGNITDIKSCEVAAECSSLEISAYGLHATDFFMNFSLRNKLVDIPLVRLALYDGAVEASATINLDTNSRPYWLSIAAQGIKLEKLKADTAAKDKELAGTVQVGLKVNGFLEKFEKLNGAGKLLITNGNLWELNLFKGLGSLLFVKDFAHIIFSQGSCDFLIENQSIFTDNVKLKSEIVNLAGPVKVGFDSSLDASLNVEVLSEMVPLTGTFKDITTAIVGKAGRFGVINLSGTLKDPKYRFKPAVVDIIKGIKDMIFRK